jgi:hypothetical protein
MKCRRSIGYLSVLCSLILSRTILADDVYAVRFVVHSRLIDGGLCVNWYDDLVFHNTTEADAVVSLLGLSGTVPALPTALAVPAGRTVSARGNVNWSPVSTTDVPLWVVHLDVPAGLVVQSRVDAFSELCIGGMPPSTVPDLGSFSLPLGRGLTPAGSKKVFLGADLGAEANHANVGVFNGGSTTANAVVEVRRACGDVLLESQTLAIAPNMLVQINGLASGLGTPDNGCAPDTPGNWVRYVTVTVDQPSFSYVVVKMDEISSAPTIPYGAPLPQ